jgi:hypothetical protein
MRIAAKDRPCLYRCALLSFLISELTVWFGSFRRARMDHAVHTWISTVKIVLNEMNGVVLRILQKFCYLQSIQTSAGVHLKRSSIM